jgi:hypothetical protein
MDHVLQSQKSAHGNLVRLAKRKCTKKSESDTVGLCAKGLLVKTRSAME